MKKILSRIYHLVLQCTRKVRINGKFIKTKHYGSEYGGFNVYIEIYKFFCSYFRRWIYNEISIIYQRMKEKVKPFVLSVYGKLGRKIIED